MSYDGLLLDYDGVVVHVLEDDERIPAFRRALRDQFRDDQLDDDIVAELAHGIAAEELDRIAADTGLDATTLWRSRDDALAAVLCNSARTGTKAPYDDVDRLFELDCPIGIASNNQRRVVEFISERYELDRRFETIHAREPHPDSLRRKKPEPTFLDAAMADMGVENPLYVGDKGSDVLAGRRAGLDTALIRRSHNATRRVDHDPTYEVTGLEQVVDIVRTGET